MLRIIRKIFSGLEGKKSVLYYDSDGIVKILYYC